MPISVPVDLFRLQLLVPSLCSDRALFRSGWRTEAPFPRYLVEQALVSGRRFRLRAFEPLNSKWIPIGARKRFSHGLDRSGPSHALSPVKTVGLQAQLFSEPLRFLSYVIRNSVALAVIDIWMSVMSGLQIQKQLQAVSPKTRVIIMTGNDDDSVRNAAIRAGAIAYFDKPFDDEAFLAALHRAMWPSECFDAGLAGSVG